MQTQLGTNGFAARLRLVTVIVVATMMVLIYVVYSANAFIGSVQLVSAFGVSPSMDIDAYVGSVQVIHADSFWRSFLVVESVDYISSCYQGTDVWIPDAVPGIGVVGLNSLEDCLNPDVNLLPARGQRLIRPEILIRIDRYKPYEGLGQPDDGDQATVTVHFRFLWIRFDAKADSPD